MSAPKTFDELPIATCPLSIEERAKWINVLDPLLKYAGSPGDWGYGSKLGLLTQRLLQVRREVAAEPDPTPTPAPEFPTGAIVNGRALIERLESVYSFECEAGPISMCDDWHSLKRCFEHLAECVGHTRQKGGAA